MQLSASCMVCLLDKQLRDIKDYPDETKKAAYLQAVMGAIASADRDVSAPYMTSIINGIHEEYFGFREDLSQEKSRHNHMMLRVADDIAREIGASRDGVEMALRYARAGNYIDLGALSEVKNEVLLNMLREAKDAPVDGVQYAYFREELARAGSLLYIMDNAGEIVMDMLLIRELKKAYPHLAITALVRGKLTSNDATPFDAREIGLDREVRVIDNGTDIPGTELKRISPEAREACLSADVILAKGQANFETLLGEGLNAFYIFLCKCDWFVKRFGLPRFTGVFIREKDVKIGKYLVGV